jgi:Dolichyl-phosphate-mannose-protein mannosyltransferase
MSESDLTAAGRTKPITWSWLPSACVGTAYFLFCLLVQYLTGAWRAGFVQYPDEPSHFVGAAMVRDWLFSGRWNSPLQFARDYYGHYPFFAIGYWPPAFHAVTGVLFAVAGVGRTQALLVPAACASITAWLVFKLLIRRVGFVPAVCAGALYLSLPITQMWMCAVMVDHMTACLSVAVGFWLLRYLYQPSYNNAIIWAVLCAFAILSKYSAVYLLALPWSAMLLFRRFDLLRKSSFFVQPVIVFLLVGPWALWTKSLTFYGLPSVRPALTMSRAISFVLQTFKIFPPVLMVFVIFGLLALLVLRKAWQEDVGVFALLCAGHLSFLFLSPVDPEQRYLLAPAASLLVLSFTGWAALRNLQGQSSLARAVAISVASLTFVFACVYFGGYPRAPQYPIAPIVKMILKSNSLAGQRLLMPPDLEGPFIAEFVAQERYAPVVYLVRPSKILAREDWFGGNYALRFNSSEQLLDYFRNNPVKLIIWHERPESAQTAHERMLGDMLRNNPVRWRKLTLFGSVSGQLSSAWAIYEYVPPQGS